MFNLELDFVGLYPCFANFTRRYFQWIMLTKTGEHHQIHKQLSCSYWKFDHDEVISLICFKLNLITKVKASSFHLDLIGKLQSIEIAQWLNL